MKFVFRTILTAAAILVLSNATASADCFPQFGTNDSDTITATPGCTAVLVGLGGDDILIGGDGDDVLWGDACTGAEAGGVDPAGCHNGADTLIGGGGMNIFAFNTAAESNATHTDVIADFVQGSDAIGIGGMCWKHRAFICSYIGTALFSGIVGEVRYTISYPPSGSIKTPVNLNRSARKLFRSWARSGQPYTTVTADMDGDGAADFKVVLLGAFDLAPSDFLLNSLPPAQR